MFKFLKLHSSSSGDAQRHVPFASIIHKHILPLIFTTVLFLTLCFRPYAAEALAQLVPEIQPVYDTTIESLYEFVKVQLDTTQQDVFQLLLGTYMVGYGGMADYRLNYVYNSDQTVKEWLINTGADLYNTILSLGGFNINTGVNGGIPQISYQQLSPLLQYAMGCAIKAKDYTDTDDIISDIQTSDSFPIPLTVDIMSSINAAMGYYDGLYNWQYQEVDLSNFPHPVWRTISNPGIYTTSYNEYLSGMVKPVRSNNSNSGNYNTYVDLKDFPYRYLLINTTTGYIEMYSIDGTLGAVTATTTTKFVAYYSSGGTNANSVSYFNVSISPVSWNIGSSTVKDKIDEIFSDGLGIQHLFFNDFINDIYIGSSWNDKTQWRYVEDDNFDVPDEPTFYKGIENGLLDLKGLLEDILGNLELRPPVINNYYYPDGSNVPVADMEPAMQNNSLPDSGVDIDQGLFSNLFRSEGKDTYISYLWYMTKPLILYTKDLFNCLIFDPVENFAASGPGYFVYGVVSLGLISGLLVKCLL